MFENVSKVQCSSNILHNSKHAEESRQCYAFQNSSVEEEVVHITTLQLSNNEHKEVPSIHSNHRRSRHSDLLFLAFHKEKPSPSGATVSLLLQQVFIFHD